MLLGDSCLSYSSRSGGGAARPALGAAGGDCRGFAFAVFSTEEGCEAAIRLNGKHRLGATPLKVKYSIN